MTRRSGLGRGLDALLPGSDSGMEGRSPGLLEVALETIDPNPDQPRRSFDEPALDELTASIVQLGVLQPLLVRATGARYELVAGERRLRAAGRAGLATVPVVLVETDREGSLERALVENLHREDLNPIEEAAAYRQLLDEGGLTQQTLADRLGRSRVAITNATRLLELPTGIQKLLVEGRLAAGHGKALLGLADNPFQERLAQRVAQEGLSVRETEDLVRRYQNISTIDRRRDSRRAERPALVTEAQRALADHLQTRVRVEMGQRKGKIVLDFVSMDELERLLNAIIGERAMTTRTASPD
jgi:ParB family transcriptional regulator, chromosome partitioning protein